MESRWLLYAMGGGLGHLQRSLSLARAAANQGIFCTIVSNSPWVETVAAADFFSSKIQFKPLPSDIKPSQAAVAFRGLLQQSWEAFVVDTFPRGLGGELAELLPKINALKVWTHRDLTPEYLERMKIREQWACQFDVLLAPGERGDLAENALKTAPWLLLRPFELMSRREARCVLGVDLSAPLVIVVGSGRQQEPQRFAQLAQRLAADLDGLAQVRFASLAPFAGAINAWPLLRLLPAADLLVGAGGYNTVHEARALKLPLFGLPQPRLYDRQARRLGASAYSSEDALAYAVRCALPNSSAAIDIRYDDGPAAAVRLLQSALGTGEITTS